MVVVRIADHRNKEIISVLRHFLERAEMGELQGLAVCAQDGADREEIAVAGSYRTNPARSVNIAMRMSWRLSGDDASG